MTEHTLRDEIDGAIQKLCSITCQNERAIRVARDTFKRIAYRVRDGVEHCDYEVTRHWHALSVYAYADGLYEWLCIVALTGSFVCCAKTTHASRCSNALSQG